METDTLIISGEKGKGGGTTSADDTRHSKAHARVILAISEGEIEGLVDGDKSIYLNNTPIRNSDGTLNYPKVTWEFHRGLPDDTYFPGHNSVDTITNVSFEVKKSIGPKVVTITQTLADAAKVVVRVDGLYSVDDNGAIKTANLTYGIDMKPAGGAWTRMITRHLVGEKMTSATQFMHRIELPLNGAPWDLRLIKLTDDATDVKQANTLTFDSYAAVVEGKFTYPHTAACAFDFDAEEIGTSAPTVTFDLKLRKILVPNNYDPITRTYTGIWNGVFATERVWSNNPAWVYYDLVENSIFGAGDLVDIDDLDKWSLYTIAQYCDQLVPSGYKDAEGVALTEPRYTYNGMITTKKEAFFALQDITKTWRGMTYWSRGAAFSTADMPSDPTAVFGPANALNGRFEYNSTSTKTRHSVVIVKFNDPDNFFASASEVVVDGALVEKWGWREKTLTLDGCSSRSLAHRYGKWVLDVENNETETVTFSAGWADINSVPGNIIAINDPRRAQVRMSGRIKSHATTRINLDYDFAPGAGATYTISVLMPTGELKTFPILQTYPAQPYRLRVANTGEFANVDAPYVISGTDVAPRTYRIISIDENTDVSFGVTALQHDPNKYARVEQNISFDPIPYVRPLTITFKPTALAASEVSYQTVKGWRTEIDLTWVPPVNTIVREFKVTVDTPSRKNVVVGTTSSNSISYISDESGDFVFYVQTLDFSNNLSDIASLNYTVAGEAAVITGEVTDLSNSTGSTTQFIGADVNIKWKNMMVSSSDLTSEGAIPAENASDMYSHNIVNVYSGTTLMRSARVVGSVFHYSFDMNKSDAALLGYANAVRSLRFSVSVVDKLNRMSGSTEITLANNPPVMAQPLVGVDGKRLNISWAPPSDIDYAGTLVWVGPAGYNPNTTDPLYDTVGGSVVFVGDSLVQYAVYIAHYDEFDRSSANISSVVLAQTTTISSEDIDGRGLNILDIYGDEVFGSNGHISSGAYVTIDGSNIQLSDMAVNSLIPNLNFVGTYATAPTAVDLGDLWKQNSVYKNSSDGKSYVLTGAPLAWMLYLEDGKIFSMTIESSNGTVFRVGSSTATMLKARIFKNGAEVTDETLASWFRWRRVSIIPLTAPNDDATFNAAYSSGYKQLSINVDQVSARATFFCDIVSS